MQVKQVNTVLLTVARVQPQTCTVTVFYTKPSSCSLVTHLTDWHP